MDESYGSKAAARREQGVRGLHTGKLANPGKAEHFCLCLLLPANVDILPSVPMGAHWGVFWEGSCLWRL